MDNTLHDKTPRYNLGVVLRETGIKPDTLRAWERRYALPQPQRSEGGHRLYSAYDIAMIKWLLARQDEGMRISNVVRQWQSLISEGKDPLQIEQTGIRTPSGAADAISGLMLSDLRQQWVDACLAFNENLAEQHLARAFALYPLETVCVEILQKGLAQVGDLWYQNKASVQQEHFASTLATRRLNTLISAAHAPERSERLLVACAPNEAHTFSALLLTLLLRQHGWGVVYLGANVPADRLQETIRSTRATLTILVAMQFETAANLPDMLEKLAQEDTLLAYGGSVFSRHPALCSKIPAHFLGSDLLLAPRQVEILQKTRPPTVPVAPLPEDFHSALKAFTERQLSIELQVLENMQLSPSLKRFVQGVDFHFSRKLVAALALADFDVLTAELDLMRGWLQNYGLQPDGLNEYLRAYRQAVRDNMGQHAPLILKWIQAYLDEDR